ncbi:hypothetical protein GCM10029992_30700 [Glycomyces albus]
MFEQLVDAFLDRVAHDVLPFARLFMGFDVRHPDHIDQEPLGQPVLAHHRDRLPAALLGQLQMAVALDVQQPVALHAADGLGDRRTALLESFGDPGPQGRNTLLLELEDGP